MATWLEGASIVVAPIRLANMRSPDARPGQAPSPDARTRIRAGGHHG
jgi:hypothetical protein